MDYDIKLFYKLLLQLGCTIKDIEPTSLAGINVIHLSDPNWTFYTYKTSIEKA